MSDSLVISLISMIGSLLIAIIPKLIDHYSGTGKIVKDISKDVEQLKKDQEKTSDMVYQILDHMATSNNTGQMKRCLEQYNEYYRHS